MLILKEKEGQQSFLLFIFLFRLCLLSHISFYFLFLYLLSICLFILFFYLGLNLFAKSKSLIKESISTKELKMKDILYPNLISLRVSLLHTVDHQMQHVPPILHPVLFHF